MYRIYINPTARCVKHTSRASRLIKSCRWIAVMNIMTTFRSKLGVARIRNNLHVWQSVHRGYQTRLLCLP